MSFGRFHFRPSFQTKILIPVLALLVLLPALTLAIVHRKSMESLANQTRESLRVADGLFQNSLELRARQLVARYKNVAVDPRFRAIAALSTPAATMRDSLNARLENEDFGDEAEIAVFLNSRAEPVATAVRDSRLKGAEFAHAAEESIHQALEGQASSTVVSLDGRIFNAVAAPVLIDQRGSGPSGSGEAKPNGVLLVGVRVGKNVLQELTSLVRGEGVFLAHGRVAASTLRTELNHDLLPHWSTSGLRTEAVEIEKAHYLAIASRFPGASIGADAGYVLLLSYERELQQLRQTQATLWLLCVLGIIVSTGVILIAVRKITAPLRELRANANAIGAGDFTRELDVKSKDEIGQLTQAFNQMTQNLRTSHAELQSTVERLKATQAQLIQSEKLSAVGEFVSGIAHELNNPLTAVIGFGEMLRQAELPPQYQKYLQYIVRSSERCHKIVHGLLSFARQHPPERKAVKLNPMIDAVIELLAYEMRTSNIEIQRDFAADLPEIMGDSHQLQQVILNLLNNARQAMEVHQASGRIRITTQAAGDKVRIVTEDNGPGIAQENLAKIFNPFFTTKPVGKGTGLGLSLCYGIISEHGGTITAHSAPGQGATFVIELPRYVPEGADANHTPKSGDTTLSGKGKRALVIDDEEWILDLVQQILHKDGFEVDVASNGHTALDHVAQSRYELLVCDWKMPGLSGPQLFDRIHALSPETANRVIFMTGDVVSESVQQFLSKHAKVCLSKPFSVDEFRQTVGEFIAAKN